MQKIAMGLIGAVVLFGAQCGEILAGNSHSIDLELDGNQYGETAATTLCDGLSRITVEFWIKPESFSSYFDVVRKIGPGFIGCFAAQITPDPNQAFYVVTAAGTKIFYSAETLTPGVWHHVAFVFDGTQAANNDRGKVYINGAAVATTVPAGMYAALGSQACPITVGRDGVNKVDGLIDEVRIWSTARTGAEIAGHYRRKLAGDETGLIWYLPMDEGAGTNVEDKASGLDLTLVHSPVWSAETPFPDFAPGAAVTETFYPDTGTTGATGDTFFFYSKTNFAGSRDSVSTGNDASDTAVIRSEWNGGNYNIQRAGFTFDTRTIGSGSIASATLEIYHDSSLHEDSNTGSLLYLVRWGPTVDANFGIPDSDIAKFDTCSSGTACGNYYSSKSINAFLDNAYTSLSLNSAGLDHINKAGVSKFGILHEKDFTNTAPTASSDRFGFHLADVAGINKDPRLTVTYKRLPDNLRCEGLANPVGVADVTPEFSALYYDPDGDASSACQLQVNSSPDFETATMMADSGKTLLVAASGSRTPDLPYPATNVETNTGATNLKDNYLSETYPNNNYAGGNLDVGKNGSAEGNKKGRVVMGWTLPLGSGLIDEIRLCLRLSGAPHAQSVDLHAVSAHTDWTEGGAVWNSPWNSPGGDYSTAVLDTHVYSGSETAGDRAGYVLKGAGATNPLTLGWGDTIHLLLKSASEGDGSEHWSGHYSKEDAGNEPSLEIAYVDGSEPSRTLTLTGQTYYWRIRFWDSDGMEGEWSTEEARFVMASNQDPLAPVIDSYHDGSYTNDTTPLLQFDLSDPDAGDAIKFRIQIADNEGFSPIEADYTDVSFVVSPRYDVQYAPAALSDGSYYWRVKCIDDDGAESDWATANGGAAAFVVDTALPPAPVLVRATYDFSGRIVEVRGAAEADAAVRVYDGAVLLGIVAADANGEWTYAPEAPLAAGVHSISARAEDAATNQSPYSDFHVLDHEDAVNAFRDAAVSHEGGASLRLEKTGSYEFRLAANAGAPVTVKAWMMKNSDYTGAAPGITLTGPGIDGTGAATASMTAEEDTWEQLTVTGTPVAPGVLTLKVEAFSTAADAKAWVDDITANQ